MVFVSLSGVAGFIGGYGRWRQKEDQAEQLAAAMAEPLNPAENDGEDLVAFTPFRPFLLQFLSGHGKRAGGHGLVPRHPQGPQPIGV